MDIGFWAEHRATGAAWRTSTRRIIHSNREGGVGWGEELKQTAKVEVKEMNIDAEERWAENKRHEERRE
jgi:hypothetical protein